LRQWRSPANVSRVDSNRQTSNTKGFDSKYCWRGAGAGANSGQCRLIFHGVVELAFAPILKAAVWAAARHRHGVFDFLGWDRRPGLPRSCIWSRFLDVTGSPAEPPQRLVLSLESQQIVKRSMPQCRIHTVRSRLDALSRRGTTERKVCLHRAVKTWQCTADVRAGKSEASHRFGQHPELRFVIAGERGSAYPELAQTAARWYWRTREFPGANDPHSNRKSR